MTPLSCHISSHFQSVVVGAGPAGMAAAIALADQGVEVAVLNESEQPGGQIYRNLATASMTVKRILGSDYRSGEALLHRFQKNVDEGRIHFFGGTSVWYLDEHRQIGVTHQGQSRSLSADKLVLAGGAQERPMPIPGWQLPGVMSAGAGQILLKSDGIAPDHVVLAGSGPLLWLLACQYLRAGVRIAGIVDTTERMFPRMFNKHLLAALSAGEYLFKGMMLKAFVRARRVPIYSCAKELQAIGDDPTNTHAGDRLTAIKFNSGGKAHVLKTAHLLLHLGVIPDFHLLEAAGCEMKWDESQQSWVPIMNEHNQSLLDGVFITGDMAGIEGAKSAEISGQHTGLQVAFTLGKIDQTEYMRLSEPLKKSYQRHHSIRPWLNPIFRVPEEYLSPPDDVMVCRCEAVSAAQVRAVSRSGCPGPNQAKAFLRCGMGPCQGRMCGTTVAQIMAQDQNKSMSEIGRYRTRPPIKPITLGELSRTQSLRSNRE